MLTTPAAPPARKSVPASCRPPALPARKLGVGRRHVNVTRREGSGEAALCGELRSPGSVVGRLLFRAKAAFDEAHPRLGATGPDVADGFDPAGVVQRARAEAEGASGRGGALRDAAAAATAEIAEPGCTG